MLGQTVVDNLFGARRGPGRRDVRIKNVPFRVIGVLRRKGQTSWGQDQDDVVMIPFTTAERRVLGTAILGTVETLMVYATRAEDIARPPTRRSRRCSASGTASPRRQDDDFTVRNLDGDGEPLADARAR